MNLTTTRYLVTPLILLGGAASAAAEESDLKQVVTQWVQTVSAIQQAENEWERDREVLQNYREGLQSEIASLKDQLAEAKVKAGAATTEQQEKIERKDALEEAGEARSGQVIALENRFSELLPLIPDPLRKNDKFATALTVFEKTLETKDRSKEGGVPGRLQTVLTLMKELEKFQNTVTVRTDVRQAQDGKEYEVEMIYLGLAKAFAVNETSNFSLVGQPTDEGWTFQEDNSLAPQVRALVDATTGDGETMFVNVPITIR